MSAGGVSIGPGRVVVVTGGASGIGRALVAICAARGADVIVLDQDEAGLAACATEFPRVLAYPCDVTDEDAVRLVAVDVRRRFRSVNLLVCNAGITASADFEHTPLPVLKRLMDVNYWGAVHCSRAFLPELRQAGVRGASSLCFVLSALALVPVPRKAGYAASKRATAAFAQALTTELEDHGISVTCAYPGRTRTNIVSRGFSSSPEKLAAEQRFLNRGTSPSAVAQRIVAAIERGRPRTVLGWDARLLDIAGRLAPGATRRFLRLYRRHAPFG